MANKQKKGKAGWVILVIFLCVLVACGVAYYFNQATVNEWFKNTFTKQKEETPKAETQVTLTLDTKTNEIK